VGGHRFGAKVGAPIRRKAPEKKFFGRAPPHFIGSEVQLVVLMSAFVMASIVWSVSYLLFFYWRCLPCLPFVKVGGTWPPTHRDLWSRRHCLLFIYLFISYLLDIVFISRWWWWSWPVSWGLASSVDMSMCSAAASVSAARMWRHIWRYLVCIVRLDRGDAIHSWVFFVCIISVTESVYSPYNREYAKKRLKNFADGIHDIKSNQTNYFIVRLKVDERAGQLSLPHLGITKTEK